MLVQRSTTPTTTRGFTPLDRAQVHAPTRALVHGAAPGASARGHRHPAVCGDCVNNGRTAEYVGNKRMLDEDSDDTRLADIPDVMGGYSKIPEI